MLEKHYEVLIFYAIVPNCISVNAEIKSTYILNQQSNGIDIEWRHLKVYIPQCTNRDTNSKLISKKEPEQDWSERGPMHHLNDLGLVQYQDKKKLPGLV